MTSPLFAYDGQSYQNEFDSIIPKNPEVKPSKIKNENKKQKQRQRLVSKEKVEDLEAKYFDEVKTLNAAPRVKSKKLRRR